MFGRHPFFYYPARGGELLKMEVKDIKSNLNMPVMFNNSIYTLTGSTIRKNKDGEIYYTAEILDKNKNSVCQVKLRDIKEIEKI
jgi:hypothetical protein